MEKMDGKTMDIVAENVGKLKELFPEAFTEDGTTKDTKGTKKIDFEVLKELLGEYVSDKDERYSFTWNGKSKARMIAQTPSTGTLRPCKEESVVWDTTQNIFIEGDNLEVLKLLQKSYHKKMKMIYIDPPYNTGKDFVYKDNFKDNIKNYKEITGQVDGEGRNLSNNPETSGRYHTDWLNMMYPRLKLARNLLKDDGVIFISIDDNEVSNLRKMCDEIFGEENFIADAIWRSKDNSNNDAKKFSLDHNHTLIFAKNSEWQPNKISDDSKRSHFKNPDNDPRGPYFDGNPLNSPNYRENLIYDLETPSGKTISPPKNGWRWSKQLMQEKILSGEIRFTSDETSIRRRTYLADMQGLPPSTLWIDLEKTGHNRQAKYELLKLLPEDVFSTPKPVKLVRFILDLVTANTNEDIVLDFFAGSGTSANAVLSQNASDNGNRKYILIQLPETTDEKSDAFKTGYKSIAEISKERIRRAAAKIREDNPLFAGDLGFKVFKLDSTNIKPWEVDFDLTERTLEDFISNIKTDRREEDVLYEILLKYGLDLTLPITEHAIAGQKVFDIGMGALIICLADAISLEVVEGIAKLKDELNPEIMRVVFKDSGFKDDVVKTNAVQILKQAGIVDVRSL